MDAVYLLYKRTILGLNHFLVLCQTALSNHSPGVAYHIARCVFRSSNLMPRPENWVLTFLQFCTIILV